MQAIRHGTMLPSLQRNEIGTSELDPFAAQYLARGLPCERFTAALASRTSCITRGRGGWLNLPRGGLPPPILCQLPGALCNGSQPVMLRANTSRPQFLCQPTLPTDVGTS